MSHDLVSVGYQIWYATKKLTLESWKELNAYYIHWLRASEVKQKEDALKIREKYIIT